MKFLGIGPADLSYPPQPPPPPPSKYGAMQSASDAVAFEAASSPHDTSLPGH